MRCFVLIFWLVLASQQENGNAEADLVIGDGDWLGRLHSNLLKGYNRDVRPVKEHSHNTTVFVGLAANHVDVDDHLQEMKVNAWSVFIWKDEYLVWDPKEYGGLEQIHFDQEEIWIPDITHYNSAEGFQVLPFGTVRLLCSNTGQVSWFPPSHFAVKCDLSLEHWPSDTHECVIRVGSWTHHGEEIDMKLVSRNGSVLLDNFEENNRWHLLGMTASRVVITLEEHDPFVEIDFTVKILRRSDTHAAYIRQSTLVVMMIILTSYLLPFRLFYARLLIHLFALAILVGCLFVLFATLPTNGGPIPYVVRYYCGALVVTCMSFLYILCIPWIISPTNERVVHAVTTTGSWFAAQPILNRVFAVSENANTYSQLDPEFPEDEPQGTPSSAPPVVTNLSRLVLRVVNFIFFFVFFICYLVDYIVLLSVV